MTTANPYSANLSSTNPYSVNLCTTNSDSVNLPRMTLQDISCVDDVQRRVCADQGGWGKFKRVGGVWQVHVGWVVG